MNNLLILSPYHSGSHKAWSEGYQSYSKQKVEILHLPGRFWKWRMHGGSVTLAKRFIEGYEGDLSDNIQIGNEGINFSLPDVIVATDMTDLTTFLALTRQMTHSIPTALYMHENQLTYPLPLEGSAGPMRRQKGERDLHYAFVNYASIMAADRVFFNSRYHFNALYDELPRFLSHFPDYNERESVTSAQEKSQILPVGIDFARLDKQESSKSAGSQPPLILWNQRWEYDKNPAAFFESIYGLRDREIPFRLAVCGEQFRQKPSEFLEAKAKLSEQIVHYGFAEPDEYSRLLWDADVVVSTAAHEFFGISILEAIHCQTFPILPNALSYPELIPKPYHEFCLYNSKDELQRKLTAALDKPKSTKLIAEDLAKGVSRYDWRNLAPSYDAIFSELATM